MCTFTHAHTHTHTRTNRICLIFVAKNINFHEYHQCATPPFFWRWEWKYVFYISHYLHILEVIIFFGHFGIFENCFSIKKLLNSTVRSYFHSVIRKTVFKFLGLVIGKDFKDQLNSPDMVSQRHINLQT